MRVIHSYFHDAANEELMTWLLKIVVFKAMKNSDFVLTEKWKVLY